MNDHTAVISYDEPLPADRERFAEMVAELQKNGTRFTIRRAHGLLEIHIPTCIE
jgi:hypothetical protein